MVKVYVEESSKVKRVIVFDCGCKAVGSPPPVVEEIKPCKLHKKSVLGE